MADDAKIDSTSLMYHPKRIAEWMERGDCYPINVEIGITNICNHHCTFCGLDWVPRTRECLDRKIMLTALGDMAQHGVESLTFSAESEPTIHPNFPEFVQYAKQRGLDVAVSSNGQLFNQRIAEQVLPHLTWIRFSVDAATPETHARVHGTHQSSFQQVIDNIRYAVEYKRKNSLPVTIGTQIVVIKDNLAEVEKLAQLMQDIGADNLQVKPYSHHPCSTLPDPSVDLSNSDMEERLKKYPGVLFRKQAVEHNKAKKYDKCYSLSFYCLIDSRGNVMPCNMFYKNPEFIYGNLYDTNGSFSKIWESERRKSIIGQIGSMKLDHCRNACVPTAKNEFLYRLKNPHAHDRFV